VIVSNVGTTIRIDAESVSRQGRAAQGVRVMNLRAGDGVSAIAKVVSSRTTDAEGATDELALEELVNEPGVAADGASPNGGVMHG
jgi:DNA gyrase subunit A